MTKSSSSSVKVSTAEVGEALLWLTKTVETAVTVVTKPDAVTVVTGVTAPEHNSPSALVEELPVARAVAAAANAATTTTTTRAERMVTLTDASNE